MRFNPCSAGVPFSAFADGPAAEERREFQSLFCWSPLLRSATDSAASDVDLGFNPCSAGVPFSAPVRDSVPLLACHVSILVLLESPSPQEYNDADIERYWEVSILVLLESPSPQEEETVGVELGEVSILVLLESPSPPHSRQQVGVRGGVRFQSLFCWSPLLRYTHVACRVPLNAVSILVLLESPSPPSTGRATQTSTVRFNPCSAGVPFSAPSTLRPISSALRFQSLFCWSPLLRPPPPTPARCMERGFNPCSAGVPFSAFSARRESTSINWFQSLFCWSPLLRPGTIRVGPPGRRRFQSLFCWSPLLRRWWAPLALAKPIWVSILVLLESPSPPGQAPTAAMLAAMFQSLFCWSPLLRRSGALTGGGA